MNIKTNYDFPPIPIRNFDWSAWNDDTYDEDSIIGHGKTELDAINNLIEMIEGNVSAPINEVKNKNEINCPSCGKLWNTNLNNSCECGAALKEERKTPSAKWDPIKKRIVVDKEQDVKPFDFNQLDADIKRMFPMKQAGRKEFITDDSMEITIFNDSPFDTLEVFSKVAGLINSILPHAQICGGRPVIK